jgi:hypothetical protein
MRRTWIILVVSAALVAATLAIVRFSRDDTAATTGAGEPMSTPIGDDLRRDRAAGNIVDVPIRIEDRYRDTVKAVTAAGVVFNLSKDPTPKVPVRVGTSVMVFAEDADHKPVAAAIAVADTNLDPTPVTVGDDSTAFVRLVTTAALLTSDVGELWALSVAANESTAYDDLVAAIANRPPTAESFATATADQADALSRTVDTIADLDKLDPGPDTDTAAGTPATQTPVQQAVYGKPVVVLAGSKLSVRNSAKTGVAVEAERHGDNLTTLTFKNKSSTYAWLTQDGQDVPYGLIPPATFQLPTVAEIVKKLTKMLISKATQFVKKLGRGLLRLGGKEKPKKAKKPTLKTLFAELTADINTPGEAEFTFRDKDARKPFELVGGGNVGTSAAEGNSVVPVGALEDVANLFTTEKQLVAPAVELLSGKRLFKPRDTLRTPGVGASLAEKERAKDLAGIDTFVADYEKQLATRRDKIRTFAADVAKEPAVWGALQDAATVQRLEDPPALGWLNSTWKLSLAVMTSQETLKGTAEMLNQSLDVTVNDVIYSIVKRYGAALIPGPGWVATAIKAADVAAGAIALAVSGLRFYDDTRKYSRHVVWDDVLAEGYDGEYTLTDPNGDAQGQARDLRAATVRNLPDRVEISYTATGGDDGSTGPYDAFQLDTDTEGAAKISYLAYWRGPVSLAGLNNLAAWDDGTFGAGPGAGECAPSWSIQSAPTIVVTIQKVKGCLGSPTRIRVKLTTNNGTLGDTQGLGDQAPENDEYTPWVYVGKPTT